MARCSARCRLQLSVEKPTRDIAGHLVARRDRYESEWPAAINCTRLEGKVALITGAASGIGEETARHFADNDAFVVIADIQDDLGQNVVVSIGSMKCSYIHCDVAVNFAVQKYGTLDILFSNAGVIGPLTGLLDLDMTQFDETFSINVRGIAATLKHAGRVMSERKIRGSIICTRSVAGCIGGVGPFAYTAAKHAVVGLVTAASVELGRVGIRVNCISPWGVGTPLACNAYKMEAKEVEESSSAVVSLNEAVLKTKHVAEAALFFASDESGFFTGHNLVVDGGFTVGSHVSERA